MDILMALCAALTLGQTAALAPSAQPAAGPTPALPAAPDSAPRNSSAVPISPDSPQGTNSTPEDGSAVTSSPDSLKGTNSSSGAENGSPDEIGYPDAKDSGSGETSAEKQSRLFFGRLVKAYCDKFKKIGENEEVEPPPRRALPSPWSSPPFPNDEYQGYPLLGVPPSYTVYPVMQALYSGPFGQQIKDSRITFEGWITSSGNWSTAKNANTPDSYWIVANHYELEQGVMKLERLPDTVQTDHVDWGFRSVGLYGIDYRYTTAGGWGSDQLLRANKLNGWDPVEQYVNVYLPWFLGGTDLRVGRWIACPDIETQYSVNNYLASHSLLFTYDTYTQTGVMLTQKINDQWTAQAALHAGTDMAPWYKGALPTGAFGVRWVSKSNNDSVYAWLNAINNAQFRHFTWNGVPAGHDNFNYVVATWQHRFTPQFFTKTESYYMWQRNAELGGTPSIGVPQFFGGGGGDGTLLPGLSNTYGVLNYTLYQLTKRDYMTVRNEWWKDERGMRSGFAGNYTSHTIGLSHQFNDVLMLRPEIGYYRNWNQPAFDLGTRHGIWIYGFDVTWRF